MVSQKKQIQKSTKKHYNTKSLLKQLKFIKDNLHNKKKKRIYNMISERIITLEVLRLI